MISLKQAVRMGHREIYLSLREWCKREIMHAQMSCSTLATRSITCDFDINIEHLRVSIGIPHQDRTLTMYFEIDFDNEMEYIRENQRTFRRLLRQAVDACLEDISRLTPRRD